MADQSSPSWPGSDSALVDSGSHRTMSLSGWVDSFPLDKDSSLQIRRDTAGLERVFYTVSLDSVFAGSSARLVALSALAEPSLDEAAVRSSLMGHVSRRRSLYRGIAKLPAGHRLLMANGKLVALPDGSELDFTAEDTSLSLPVAIERLRTRLEDSIEAHFTPGRTAFLLSGGVDSAVLLLLAASIGISPLHAFAFGIEGERDSGDLKRAERIARLAGARFTPVLIQEAVFPERFTSCVLALEDVVSDTLPLMKFEFFRHVAAAGYTSCVSGLGADEVFAGDPRHLTSLVPPGTRMGIGFGQREVLRRQFPEWTLPAEVRPAAAHGLEVRLPYLSAPAVQFAASLPHDFRVRDGVGKYILRELLSEFAEPDVCWQPKVSRAAPARGATTACREAWRTLHGKLLEIPERWGVSRETLLALLGAVSGSEASPGLEAASRQLMRLSSLRVLSSH